jgi:hypothetical protein
LEPDILLGTPGCGSCLLLLLLHSKAIHRIPLLLLVALLNAAHLLLLLLPYICCATAGLLRAAVAH